MGCGGSKLDDLEAVALCRDRCQLLEAAIRHRYSLAQAHIAYLHSLKSVASSLQRFFDLDHVHGSPTLHLPTQRKGDPDPTRSVVLDAGSPDLIKPPRPASSLPIHHSHSNSGSHIHLHSDGSDSDSDGSDSPFHDHETLPPNSTQYYMNFAKSKPPAPSVSYEQRPQSPEKVHFGGGPSSYPTTYSDFQNHNPTMYSAFQNHNPTMYSAFQNHNPSSSDSYNQYTYSNYGGGITSFFGSQPADSYSSPQRAPVAAAKPEAPGEEPPPPPPPPPKGSSWDFLNPFESSTDYYPAYTPSRDSKELREEEGIPDLEEEEYQHEVVKEVYGEKKLAGGLGYYKGAGGVEGRRGIGGEVEYGMRPQSAVGESSEVEYGVPMVDKNVIANKKPLAESQDNVAPVKSHGLRAVADVVSEVKEQFDRASDSGGEVSKILEVGKLPYCGKNSVYKVSSKMLDVISQPCTSKGVDALAFAENVDPLSIDLEAEMMMKSKTLSSTLEKLFIWEKKLYEEVKVEEKLQIIHERKCRRLQHLDERGAEAHKIESTRTLIRNLSTKIRIALHFVDSISSKINKLRDEDLWPQIDQLIQGLLRMWKVMLECHQRQCQIIIEAGNLNALTSSASSSVVHMEATMQLEQDLLNWILSFYAWISAQKSYVKALNGWLLKCIHYEPEVTPDGEVPFSPGRIGAPPVFVICNHWFQVMDRIKDNESEVFDAMRAFSESVLQLWDRYHSEQRPVIMANKDNMDRIPKPLEREKQKMQNALDIVNKKLVLVSEENDLTPPGQITRGAGGAGIESGLKHIFDSMERFSDISMRGYEELHLRCEEVRPTRENSKVP